ncbi:MAG: hypothetical protein M1378_11375, partial [Bacteroidetes bacterium]|nr:hypothetical protein [Bacteroidota bacterium]
MIKNLNTRVQIDKRGKIKIGGKSEKGYPVSFDYFDLKAFPELQRAYGDKPNSLRVMFPSDNLNDIASNDYRLYNSKRLVRKCDGIECVHLLDNNGHHAGEITQCICQPNMKDACTPYMMLKVFVLTKEDKIINPYAYALVT